MIKTVIFDIDNTLYDFDHANLNALDALGDYAQEHFGWEKASFIERNRDMMRKMHEKMGDVSAYHNRVIRFQNMLEEAGLPLYPHALAMYGLYWDTVLKRAVISPGAAETMKELKERELQIGIGTDMTTWIQLRKLETLGLLTYVDFLVSSEEAGVEKPHRELFELCAAKAGCEPSECLFIGDSLARDYHGALNAGMKALWFDPPGGTFLSGDPGDEPVEKISRMKEVLSYL